MKSIVNALGKLAFANTAYAVVVLMAATANLLPGQTLTNLVTFTYANGADPNAALTQGTDGNLYGTTPYGGAYTACAQQGYLGCGTVFKITPDGSLTTIYSFCAQSGCPDGARPFEGLIQSADGNFYGVTSEGGASTACPGGCGTIFKITPGGALTTFYSFCTQGGYPNCTDGYDPDWLIQANNGEFYGTTFFGGPNDGGTVFKINASGALTTVHAFNNSDGVWPTQLIQSVSGELYGVTLTSGAHAFGTVFKIAQSGKLTTLYSFCSQSGCTDGQVPNSLVQAADGGLYGTTEYGGAATACTQSGYSGCGTIFHLTTSGALTTLHTFTGSDGFAVWPGLLQGTDGNLYGTTQEGGYNYLCPAGCGTIFKITLGGVFTNLYSFASFSNGATPQAMVQDTDGNFYAATGDGGPDGAGTIFRFSVGLSPFAGLRPRFGAVGQTVQILGIGLSSATSVTFNGTAASFNVVSDTEITAVVPVGATTGKVAVVTPSGTLFSGGPFRVRP